MSANHLSIRRRPGRRCSHGARWRKLGRLARRAALTWCAGHRGLAVLPPVRTPCWSAAPARGAAAGRAAPRVVTGGPQPCAAARDAAASSGAYTDDQIASAYGLSGSYRSGDLGAGITVAVYELEPVAASDLAAFQACYGINVPIGYVRVDGGAGSGEGSGESALDIENVLGLRARRARCSSTRARTPTRAPRDRVRTTCSTQIVSQDRAQVVTISWGECESALGDDRTPGPRTRCFSRRPSRARRSWPPAATPGPRTARPPARRRRRKPPSMIPASQPFVTGVGGTTLSSLGPRPTERCGTTEEPRPPCSPPVPAAAGSPRCGACPQPSSTRSRA